VQLPRRGAMTSGMDVPETRYAKSGEIHIAYRVFGQGSFDVVVVPPLFFSIDLMGNEPRALAAFGELASTARRRIAATPSKSASRNDRVCALADSNSRRANAASACSKWFKATDSPCLVRRLRIASRSPAFGVTTHPRVAGLQLVTFERFSGPPRDSRPRVSPFRQNATTAHLDVSRPNDCLPPPGRTAS
jgi:hypothetical protein